MQSFWELALRIMACACIATAVLFVFFGPALIGREYVYSHNSYIENLLIWAMIALFAGRVLGWW